MRLILWAVLGLSLGVAVWAAALLFREGQSWFWTPVPAIVTESEVVWAFDIHSVDEKSASPTRTRLYRRALRYSYQLNGRDHESSRLGQADIGLGELERMQALTDHYPVGAAVTAYVAPDDPSNAVLDHGVSPGAVSYLFFAVAAASGSWWFLHGLAVEAARQGRRNR